MSIQSKPATQDSRNGHDRVFGAAEHINAACCTCAQCLFRRAKVVEVTTPSDLGFWEAFDENAKNDLAFCP